MVPGTCRWATLEHHVYGQELKNLVERMNQYVKDRVECFDDPFTCIGRAATGSTSTTGSGCSDSTTTA
jgi:hypothetical protein